MLVVVANIETQTVEGTVIRVSFRLSSEYVVLSDKMGSTRVQRPSEIDACQKVIDWTHSEVVDNHTVKGEARQQVQKMPTGDGLASNQAWAKRIKEDLVGQEEEFARKRREQLGFEASWNVRVDPINTLILVMFHVVGPETQSVREDNYGICHQPKQLVGVEITKEQEMRNFMDSKELGLGQGSAHDVRGKEELPSESHVAQKVRTCTLNSDDGQYNILASPFVPHQLPNLGVLLEDFLTSGKMWFFAR